MSSIQLIRSAIVDAKRLDHYHQDRLPDFLDNLHQYLENGECRFNPRNLSGHHLGLTRLRHGDEKLRVFCKLDGSASSVIAIRLRDDNTYTENFNNLPFAPGYIWNGERGAAWRNWLYGGFNRFPTLTDEQKKDTQLVNQKHFGQWQSRASSGLEHSDRLGFSVSLIQSPPGTGKTITAVLQACHYYQQGWNICFILPESLLREVEQFQAIRNIDRSLSNQFFIGTFQSWVHTLWLGGKIKPATPEMELQAFTQIHTSKHQLVTPRDLMLYQAFVLEQSQDVNFEKMAIYQQNKSRITQLKNQVDAQRWRKALGEHFCRQDTAQYLKANPPAPIFPGLMGTIIIIDEAQDYLLSELDAIKNLCQDWTSRQNHYTILWLLGDLNQRIQPVNFTWANLQLKQIVGRDWQIYRNTQSILKFANPFLKWGQKQTYKSEVRRDEMLAPSNRGYTTGEPVRLVVCDADSDAWEFLSQLQQAVNIRYGDEAEESLLRQLAQQVRILVPKNLELNPSFASENSTFLEFLNVDQVKGREFESSVVFRLFIGESLPDLEQSYRWYTLLTRTRARLLVVVTTAELKAICQRLGNDISDPFMNCQKVNPTDAVAIAETIDWIITAVSNADIAERPEYVSDRWLEQWCGSQSLNFNVEAAEIYQQLFLYLSPIQMLNFEQKAIQRLRQHRQSNLNTDFEASQQWGHISFRCLLLRAMHRSWDAVETANFLKESHPDHYRHILTGIATDLEQNGLPYEAIRVRYQIEDLTPHDYPYPELLERSGSLFPLLYELLQNRFISQA